MKDDNIVGIFLLNQTKITEVGIRLLFAAIWRRIFYRRLCFPERFWESGIDIGRPVLIQTSKGALDDGKFICVNKPKLIL